MSIRLALDACVRARRVLAMPGTPALLREITRAELRLKQILFVRVRLVRELDRLIAAGRYTFDDHERIFDAVHRWRDEIELWQAGLDDLRRRLPPTPSPVSRPCHARVTHCHALSRTVTQRHTRARTRHATSQGRK